MDENRRNYYRILHVQPDAPAEVIRSSYRTIMQRLRAHPDLGGDNRAATLINEAYAVLTDPARRAAYDATFRPRYQRTAPDGTLPPAPRLPEGLQTGTFVVCAFCREPYTHGRKVLADTLCAGCGSPLYPASRQRDASRGRALPRLERNHRVVLFTRWQRRQARRRHLPGGAARDEQPARRGRRPLHHRRCLRDRAVPAAAGRVRLDPRLSADRRPQPGPPIAARPSRVARTTMSCCSARGMVAAQSSL